MKQMNLNLGNFKKILNNKNELTPILTLENGLKSILQIDSTEIFNIYIPARYRKESVSITKGINEIQIDTTPAKHENLNSCVIVENEDNKKRYRILDIKEDMKIIVFESEQTESVNLNIYYLTVEGMYSLIYEKNMSDFDKKIAVQGTLRDFNSHDQFKNTYEMKLPNRIIFNDWKLSIYVDTPAEINFNNELAYMSMPIIEYTTDEFIKIISEKGFTIDMLKKEQLNKD